VGLRPTPHELFEKSSTKTLIKIALSRDFGFLAEGQTLCRFVQTPTTFKINRQPRSYRLISKTRESAFSNKVLMKLFQKFPGFGAEPRGLKKHPSS